MTLNHVYLSVTCRHRSQKFLSIADPPSMSIPRTSVRVIEAQPANLTCLVDSNPSAIIRWTKLGHNSFLRGNIREQTFHIPSASRQDAGTYKCSADNGLPPMSVGTVTLEVLYPPQIGPSMDERISILQGDEEFSLECVVEGNPKPKVMWRRKDTKLYWKNPLRFHLVRYDIEGTYQCVATSDGFTQRTKDVFIDVVGKPKLEGEKDSSTMSALTGETARLGCTVMADPLPHDITWMWRNNYGQEETLSSGSSHIVTIRRNQQITSFLTIPKVAVQDAGNYVCKATNMFGSVKRNIDLQISDSFPDIILITSITAGAILLLTVVAVVILVAKKKGWICKSHQDAPYPIPPVPKYVYKTGTIDSGVEDLQELREMYGTLKPRPPPRVEKKWELVGLSYTGLVHSTSLPPYSAVDHRNHPGGEAVLDISPNGSIERVAPLGSPVSNVMG
ncbi:HMCN1 [Branchiostoma lanceolatum]|uniref:HMCN1 protein n=1 Tax=Branchiostoma lanceolatum TaxID=7740 RepID=A0A8J9YNK2_BRALA|nr:HMCN1 [Branchiostoma lanceolatum]